MPCVPQEACDEAAGWVGPEDISNTTAAEFSICTTGYRGFACQLCIGGYTKVGDSCEPCSGSIMTVVWAAGIGTLIIGIVVVVVYGLIRDQGELSARPSLQKIVLNHLQMGPLLLKLRNAENMGPAVMDMLRGMNFVSVASPESAISVACIMKDPDTNSVFVQSQIAIVAMLGAVIVMVCTAWWAASCRKRNLAANAFLVSTTAEVKAASQSPPRRLTHTVWFERAILTVIVICHICFAPLSQRMAANFACVSIPEESYENNRSVTRVRRFLAQDPSLPCYGPETMLLGAVMMFLVLLIPGGFVWAMRSERRLLARKIERSEAGWARFRRMYGYLTSNYTEASWWWEAVVMLRKALLTALIVLTAPQGTLLQLQSSALLLVVLLLIQTYRKPYDKAYIQVLDVSSLFILSVSFISATFFFNDDPQLTQRSHLRLTASIVIIVGNAGWLCWAFVLLVQGFLEELYLRRHPGARRRALAARSARSTNTLDHLYIMLTSLLAWLHIMPAPEELPEPTADGSKRRPVRRQSRLMSWVLTRNASRRAKELEELCTSHGAREQGKQESNEPAAPLASSPDAKPRQEAQLPGLLPGQSDHEGDEIEHLTSTRNPMRVHQQQAQSMELTHKDDSNRAVPSGRNLLDSLFRGQERQNPLLTGQSRQNPLWMGQSRQNPLLAGQSRQNPSLFVPKPAGIDAEVLPWTMQNPLLLSTSGSNHNDSALQAQSGPASSISAGGQARESLAGKAPFNKHRGPRAVASRRPAQRTVQSPQDTGQDPSAARSLSIASAVRQADS